MLFRSISLYRKNLGFDNDNFALRPSGTYRANCRLPASPCSRRVAGIAAERDGPWLQVFLQKQPGHARAAGMNNRSRRFPCDTRSRVGSVRCDLLAGAARTRCIRKAFRRCTQPIRKYNRDKLFHWPIFPFGGRNRRWCNGGSPGGTLFQVRLKDRNCQAKPS